MKVGILTYQNAHNYGANLQMLAMKLYLEKNGYEVEIINYINKKIASSYSRVPKYVFDGHNIKSSILSVIRFLLFIVKFIYAYKAHVTRYDKFEKYLNNLIDTPLIYDVKEIAKLDLDFIICGSDQIWNPILTDGLDGAYFCNFETNATKIAYAASMGLKELPNIEAQKFEAMLANFDFISVREEALKDYTEKFTPNEVETVLDPTLLLDMKDYDILAKKPIQENYVLVYTLSENKKLLEIAEYIAQKNNLQVIELRVDKKLTHMKYNQVSDADPDEFLGYIKYADKVVTNSFHGAIFSILFQKDFYILREHWGATRLETLLKTANVMNRYIADISEIKAENKIDFAKAVKNLEKSREKSIEFLKKALTKKNHISFVNEKTFCMGCTACVNICPTKAITMKEDEEGFLYPIIDVSKCIKCGKCKKVCPLQNKFESHEAPTMGLAIKAKNEEVRARSQSGGIGYILAKRFLNDGGIVCGCVLNENLKAEHVLIEHSEDLVKLCGSKYVQSDMKSVIKEIKGRLVSGTKVLFFGTSCQVAGLNNFISDDNLFTCDLICHGVPSPMIYREYLETQERVYGKKIKHFNFRNKKYGWSVPFETLHFTSNKSKTSFYYRDLFYSDCALRPACYECKFANLNRVSDITIGDFWGIEKLNSDMLDGNGISLGLINTKNGHRLINSVMKDIVVQEYEISKCLQHNLQKPTAKPNHREAFWELYKKDGILAIIKKYSYRNFKYYLKNKLVIIKKDLKRYILNLRKR